TRALGAGGGRDTRWGPAEPYGDGGGELRRGGWRHVCTLRLRLRGDRVRIGSDADADGDVFGWDGRGSDDDGGSCTVATVSGGAEPGLQRHGAGPRGAGQHGAGGRWRHGWHADGDAERRRRADRDEVDTAEHGAGDVGYGRRERVLGAGSGGDARWGPAEQSGDGGGELRGDRRGHIRALRLRRRGDGVRIRGDSQPDGDVFGRHERGGGDSYPLTSVQIPGTPRKSSALPVTRHG